MTNTILHAESGSSLYGTAIQGSSDRDEMGICIEPPSYVIGLESFEQYESPKPAKGERSGPGDTDLTIYSLRKWASLAAQGNPTVLLLLFAPPAMLIKVSDLGQELQRRKDMFVSKEAGRRFIGYLDAQRERMLGLRNQRTNRPELIDIYGFDTKFAYHAVRLGLQGTEFLTTGNITLPIPEPDRTWLRELRVGRHTKEEALARINDSRADLEKLIRTADVPDKVDYSRLNRWLIKAYREWWDQ